MQAHEWMRRRRQQPRNGNRGEDRFRPRFYYLWISFKNSALYIHTDWEYTHHSVPHTHTHTRQWEPSGSISELKHLEIREYRHHTSSPALFAFPLPGRAAEEEGHPLFKSILMKQRMWDSLSWDWHFFCVAVGAAMHARLEWMQLALLWRWAAYELCTDGEIGRGGWRKRM